MAFPLPEHLPRATFTNEGASFGSTSSHAEPFVKKIASTGVKELDKARAGAWVRDLDKAILDTKDRLRSKIMSSQDTFEQQLESSRQVQTRLRSLSTSVEDLEDTVNNTESGLLPSLLASLAAHSLLAQRSQDADVLLQTTTYITNCRNEIRNLQRLADEGLLHEAVKQAEILGGLIDYTPNSLRQASLILGVRKRHRALANRVQEQLAQSYTSCVAITTSEFLTTFRIQRECVVDGTAHSISLSDILASMSDDALSSKLSSLRKEVVQKLIIPSLSQPTDVPTQDNSTFTARSPSDDPSDPLQILQGVLSHLHSNLVQALPASIKAQFTSSLYQPVAEAVLALLLKPGLPSTISDLPLFLQRVAAAVALEKEMASSFAIVSGRKTLIQDWAVEVGTHYERQRRETIITSVRDLLNDPEEEHKGVGVRVEEESELPTEGTLPVLSASHMNPSADTSGSKAVDDEESAWDFDADATSGSLSATDSVQVVPPETPAEDINPEDGEDGWGFDDDIEPLVSPPAPAAPTEPSATSQGAAPEGDGWGWDDDPPLTPQVPISAPKPAKGLEKFALHKAPASEASMSAVSSNVAVAPLVPPPVPALGLPPKAARKAIKETYLVSPYATQILEIAHSTYKEGQQLLASSVFPPPTPARGNMLLMTSPSIFDLYRALYPMNHANILSSSSETTLTYSSVESMQFANDCKYLAGQIEKMRESARDDALKKRFADAQEKMKAASVSWFQKTLEVAVEAIGVVLSRANGFIESSEDQQFRICRNAVEQVVDDITSLGRSWKSTLTRTAYYEAIGSLVDDTLARMIDDLTALPDIPEVESHRLSELLRMFTPLEELFLDGDQSLVVTHVPLWLKFSYMAELLVASMTDISYLFDEGALIDFTVPELTRLVRALFADTPLRAQTIEKISAGHPVSA